MIQKRKKLKRSNILYITHNYKDWIKDPIELMSKNFNHVYVLVWHKPIADLLKPLTKPWFLKLEEKLLGQTHTIFTFDYKFNLRNLPENVTVIPVNIWYLPFKWWLDRIGNYHFNQVVKAIEKNNIKFDVIHSHAVWSAGFVGMKLKERYGKPLVVTGHGRDIYQRPFESSLRMKRTEQVLKSADALSTVSNANSKIIRKMVGRSDVSIIPNGIDTVKFQKGKVNDLRAELGLDLNKKYCITVGHIEPVKGQVYLINAIKKIAKKLRNLRFIIIGEGPDYLKIRDMVREYGLEKHVIFTGSLSHTEVAKWMQASDFYILPSLAEGNPTVMFEALACGLPFIGTKVGGVPEIITPKVGILVKAGSVKGLVEGISKGVRKRWNREVILKYGKSFDWNVVCEKYLDIYGRLVK